MSRYALMLHSVCLFEFSFMPHHELPVILCSVRCCIFCSVVNVVYRARAVSTDVL